MDLASARTSLIAYLKERIRDERVINAIARVPRELFVPTPLKSLAYANEPLPIQHQQTISQPLIVAMMTEALDIKESDRILEIGTGSGYQTAILAELAREVITTERITELSQSAAERLRVLGYSNIQFQITPTQLGWPVDAPYDAIIVTAATPRVPDTLLRQLDNGGRMVVPVGDRQGQELFQITKIAGSIQTRNMGGCRFVPLIGEEAWD
jgi:protein-L-isoaspartate(D-aspartate) O-methyltransferase